MKKLNTATLYKIICLPALIFMVADAQAKKPDVGESAVSSTLGETLDFAGQKLAAHFYNDPGTADKGINYKTVSAKLVHNGDCQGIKYLETQRYGEDTYVMTYEFSLSDMDPDRITVVSKDWGGEITLVTLGIRDKVLFSKADSQGKTFNRSRFPLVSFQLTDLQIAERLGKAFKYAIKLCSGSSQKKPF